MQVIFQLLPSFRLIQQKAELFLHLFLLLLPDRQDHLQGLDHGAAVVVLHPGREGHQFPLDGNALLGNVLDFLDLRGIVVALFRKADDIPLGQPVSFSKRDLHLTARRKGAFQTGRHGVLKDLIQFFMSDIYDNICVHVYDSSSSTSAMSTRSSMGYFFPLIS